MNRDLLSGEYKRFPKHWEVISFTKAFKDMTGGQTKIPKGDYLESGDIPIIDQGQDLIGGYTNERQAVCDIRLPCVVFGDHTKIFKFVTKPFALGADGVKVLSEANNIDPKFAYYFLNTLNLPDVGYSRYFRFLKRTFFPLPPLEEQRRIAAILDKADGVRRKRKEAIRLTEELLKSTFLEMFGDPVTNPKGWEIAKLGDFGKILTGNTPPRSVSENYGDEIEWIKSDNITTPEHFLTEAEEKLSAKGKKIARTVPNGSVLVTCIAGSRSSIGRAALTDREVAFNQQINAVVPNSDVDPYFLYGQLFVAQHLVQAQSTDSMKGMVNKSKFSSIEFIKPPSQKQQKFGKWFLGFHRYYMNLISGEEQSENLFNSLLQRAFRGEL
ncbi:MULTISPECIES: restriction endonuclease subunit S [unclassified Microcystis]|uniref:restriction endonuclease subunit S n=1 Tax=unclassified Microcystis TaxID=2643300 RepID=UPI0022C8CC12|nr:MULTISPECIES: restriction endonuclease subunit S [unclassified Microcystis]MCA2692061.1 restriction endonuclease subunit S [Microcystis sp. M034S2]MCA2749118.1 restriction endonuclease subunit S [Microcystis sp. M144S2]MCZ8202162.1 restriction endonuclease subunit S [Microcystis sp. LE19-55.1A]MCZ8308217.1 restriction endonuclease subunit S [Microcystis sp. LE19-98.1E]